MTTKDKSELPEQTTVAKCRRCRALSVGLNNCPRCGSGPSVDSVYVRAPVVTEDAREQARTVFNEWRTWYPFISEQLIKQTPIAASDLVEAIAAAISAAGPAAKWNTRHRSAAFAALVDALKEILLSGVEFDGHKTYVVMQVDREAIKDARAVLDLAEKEKK